MHLFKNLVLKENYMRKTFVLMLTEKSKVVYDLHELNNLLCLYTIFIYLSLLLCSSHDVLIILYSGFLFFYGRHAVLHSAEDFFG